MIGVSLGLFLAAQATVGVWPAPTASMVVSQTAAQPTAAPAAAPKTNYRSARKGRFTFEFSKAEITDVVKAISDITQRNFIIPEKLKSQRLTILSPVRINAAEAFQVFNSALAVNNITLVRVGKFYKLVESKDSMKTTIPTCIGPEDSCPKYIEQMVTELIPLKHVDGSQMNKVLKGLVSREGELTFFAPTNGLIVSEYAPNLVRVKKMIAALDVPGFDDELRIVHIDYASASDIADKITQIFDVSSQRSSSTSRSRSRGPKTSPRARDSVVGGDDDEVQISKIVADDRTNQIIIKANRRSFSAIEGLIAKLDVPISEADQGKVQVYYLENASAEELASTLSSLAQENRAGTSPSGARRSSRGAAANRETQETASLFEGEVRVTADKATNSLIIVASPHDYRAMRSLIEKLDMPRRQVYVEAAILEVTVSDNQNVGTNWHAPVRISEDDAGGFLGGSLGFVQSSFAEGGLSPTITALATPESLLGVAGSSLVGLVGEGITVDAGGGTVTLPSFGVILKWLQSSSRANVLSTPHILTTDNEEATIEVGQRIPFRRGTSLPAGLNLGNLDASGGNLNSALGGFGSAFSAFDRIDVNLTLTITPHINERNKIRLDIDQKIEDVTDVTDGQPTTSNRAAKTVVMVDDQQTVVIGGLMRDRTIDSDEKVPFLGDLPIVGWLFKRRTSQVVKVNLLLVLTPYIIREQSDFQNIFERKVNEYEEFAAEFYGSLPEYRAHIDYSRKLGPMARRVRFMRNEMDRVENGGVGGSDSLLIEPRQPQMPKVPPRPQNPGQPNPAPVPKESIPDFEREADSLSKKTSTPPPETTAALTERLEPVLEGAPAND